ncbi:MAG TPA: DUF1905 domain-containing protein [Patescibacteria group bacterium]|nr:DUF1905 domain-containing protein [Patescibacteria group bacterium]
MLKYNQYEFFAAVWLWPGPAAWHFVTLPKDMSEHITKMFGDRKRGWGSLPVAVTIGSTVWNTSIFPDKKLGSFVLPLKKTVRKKEGIDVDQKIKVMIEIRI